ncbi:MAG: amino acid ABC transporter permease [Paracoccaceae bacterium]
MRILSRLRPSSLIILAALPFIVWLFATSPNYGRSLTAILGVERGSGAFVPGFLLSLAASLGMVGAALWRGRRGQGAAAISLASWAWLTFTGQALPFVASVVANAVDPFTSDLVVRGETPRRLTAAAAEMVGRVAGQCAVAGLVLTAALVALIFLTRGRVQSWSRRLLAAVGGLIAAYLLLVAYIGFAAGVATSIRAAILAYLLAILLGLSWVGLMQLRAHRRTPYLFAALTLAFVAAAGWQFSQPKIGYVLVGSFEGKAGVIKGTPDSLIAALQLGAFPGAPEGGLQLRSYASAEAALAALPKGEGTSAVLAPEGAVMPDGQPVLWQVAGLPDGNRAAGAGFSVTAVLLFLLTFAGVMHRRHPLSVAAEFIIDTIRGIPMLVIVLYIGLPLAGAVKEASGGFIDPPNLMRGILAMALAYSAYLAEIFRSGINAVPTGQIEAARSLGLSRWMTARHVILPQAFRIIIPPLGNEFIAILKDTSLLSILSIRDITQRMREFQSASFLPFAPYNSAAIFYVLLTLVAASLVASVERKYHVARR